MNFLVTIEDVEWDEEVYWPMIVTLNGKMVIENPDQVNIDYIKVLTK